MLRHSQSLDTGARRAHLVLGSHPPGQYGCAACSPGAALGLTQLLVLQLSLQSVQACCAPSLSKSACMPRLPVHVAQAAAPIRSWTRPRCARCQQRRAQRTSVHIVTLGRMGRPWHSMRHNVQAPCCVCRPVAVWHAAAGGGAIACGCQLEPAAPTRCSLPLGLLTMQQVRGPCAAVTIEPSSQPSETRTSVSLQAALDSSATKLSCNLGLLCHSADDSARHWLRCVCVQAAAEPTCLECFCRRTLHPC